LEKVSMNSNEVDTAFDIVLEEIENTIEALRQQAIQAIQSGDHNVARDIIDRVVQAAGFRTRVKALLEEWRNVFTPAPPPGTRKRLERGLRTPADAFRIPILVTLVELGGSAPMAEVLKRVEAKMRDQLNEHDYSPLPSDPTLPRWRNTAQWARYEMVREGLMSPNSPRGIWEITQAGRQWLAAQTTPHV
jgi:restriction system protein